MSTRSILTEHRLQHEHDFDWNNIQILDEKPCYNKRLISEMLNIKKQKNNYNLQTNTEGLHMSYIPIINKIWHCNTKTIFNLLFFSQCLSVVTVTYSFTSRRILNTFIYNILILYTINFISWLTFSTLFCDITIY